MRESLLPRCARCRAIEKRDLSLVPTANTRVAVERPPTTRRTTDVKIVQQSEHNDVDGDKIRRAL